MRAILAIAALGIIASTPVRADLNSAEMAAARAFVGTQSVIFQPLTRQGTLMGCSLVYKTVAFDDHYKQGQPFTATGNITVSVAKGNYGVSLKVIVDDFVRIIPEVRTESSRPAFIYLATSGGVTNAKSLASKFDSDSDGGLVAVYPADDSFFAILDHMLKTDEVIVAFSRTSNGLDVKFPVDIAVTSYEIVDDKVVRQRGPENGLRFVECMSQLK